MVTGIGSGIGAIFGAPLGGAVLATEILYRDDFDATALLPSFVASIVGYVIFGAAVGYTPLFGFNASYHFTNPSHLLWFALIGVLGASSACSTPRASTGSRTSSTGCSCPGGSSRPSAGSSWAASAW